jgi:tetratricopeptide (TPR) repeat protein
MAEQTEYPYDVFISYSHADEVWVTGTLLPRLEGAGLRVCIDYRDFDPGRPSLVNMENAVERSRKTLIVLTPAWVESVWTTFEGLLIQTDDPAARRARMIPLLLKPCKPAKRIAMLTYVDFTRPDRLDIAWTQLLTAVGAPPLQEAPETPTRGEWRLAHSYPMPPNFTGRLAERQMLSRWLNGDSDHPLLVLRALGGFGKSALAWHCPADYPRVVWWGFYDEREFDSFLRETLTYLGVDPRGLGPRQQADKLLRLLHQPGTLLILDGFERALRAYSSMMAAYQGDDLVADESRRGSGHTASTHHASRITHHAPRDTQHDCVSPIAEHFLQGLATLPGIRGKVLMTTRLLPRILQAHGLELLQGCCEEELTQMQPADAVAFFGAQGIRGSRAEIERACEPYGYHPLSLRLLAGLIVRDPQQPGDVRAAQRLDVSGDLKQRRHHVLQQAYNNLTPARQQLLSRFACFRGAVSYEPLQALAAEEQESQSEKRGFLDRLLGRPKRAAPVEKKAGLRADLRDLVARGLLHRDHQTHRYDLHPIVRRYAYDRLGSAEREAAHGQLRDYFAAVPPPERVQTLDDLAPVIELYHHTVQAGQYDEAVRLFRDRLATPLYYQFGAYQLQIELLRALFPDGEDKPPRLKGESDQAWTLNALANSYGLSGQPRRAVPLFEASNVIDEKRGDKQGVAIGLGNLAGDHLRIGALRAAEANLRRQIALCREIEDEFNEAAGHQELGRLLAYRGLWDEAEEELAASTRYWRQTNDVQGICMDEAYRALRALLLARAVGANGRLPLHGDPVAEALAAARRALELADEDARTRYPLERDYVRAHWLLGAAHRANAVGATGRSSLPEAGRSPLQEADRHLTEALTRCRRINAVDAEADILLDLARLRQDQAGRGERPFAQEARPFAQQALPFAQDALRLAQEALIITERSDYVLQGADVRLFLAQTALEDGDEKEALEHARKARQLATCDGPPDHTYKVAYDEAGALLEE